MIKKNCKEKLINNLKTRRPISGCLSKISTIILKIYPLNTKLSANKNSKEKKQFSHKDNNNSSSKICRPQITQVEWNPISKNNSGGSNHFKDSQIIKKFNILKAEFNFKMEVFLYLMKIEKMALRFWIKNSKILKINSVKWNKFINSSTTICNSRLRMPCKILEKEILHKMLKAAFKECPINREMGKIHYSKHIREEWEVKPLDFLQIKH